MLSSNRKGIHQLCPNMAILSEEKLSSKGKALLIPKGLHFLKGVVGSVLPPKYKGESKVLKIKSEKVVS